MLLRIGNGDYVFDIYVQNLDLIFNFHIRHLWTSALR